MRLDVAAVYEASRKPARGGFPSLEKGFSLVELIATIVILGILAITVLPRFGAISGITARGYADQIEAYLRYAQKSAIAQRRPVRIELSADPATVPVLCIAAAVGAGCPAACDATNALASPLRFDAATGVTPTAGIVCFDTLGRPGAGIALAVGETGGGVVRTVSVEAESGYVRAQ